VTRKGIDIRQHAFAEKGVDTGIGYGMLYKEFEACVEAGLSLEKWFGGEYDLRFMAKVIAWWQLRRLISSHTSDAEAQELKAKSKRH